MTEHFPTFIHYYMDHLVKLGRQPSTIKRYQYDLFDFSSWLQSSRQTTKQIDWKSITKEELDQFFEELVTVRHYHVRTIRRIHSVLRQVARYQKSNGSSELRAVEGIGPPSLKDDPLSPSEWVTHHELKELMHSVISIDGLSPQQLETFSYYKERNLFILRLFIQYGLTLQEVHYISMDDIKFEGNELKIRYSQRLSRVVKLEQQDKLLAYTYYTKIPEPVRPRYHSREPFFVAFDFKRKTFHWSYDEDMPKRMTIIAIQKMLRMEVRRAGLRKGISAQTLRHTYILKQLLLGTPTEKIMELIGHTSSLSIKRYENTAKHLTPYQKNNLFGLKDSKK